MLRAIRRATDLSRRRMHRAANAARSFSTPLRCRSRLGLKFYLGGASSTDRLAFKFYRLNFAQNRDRAPSTDFQTACRAVVPAAADCVRAPSRAGADAHVCEHLASRLNFIAA